MMAAAETAVGPSGGALGSDDDGRLVTAHGSIAPEVKSRFGAEERRRLGAMQDAGLAFVSAAPAAALVEVQARRLATDELVADLENRGYKVNVEK